MLKEKWLFVVIINDFLFLSRFFSFKYAGIYIDKPMSVKTKYTLVEYEKRAKKEID
jgi:hypothetical protein